MKNKEKFLKLVSDRETKTIEKNSERIKKRKMLRASQNIAMAILDRLDELGWTQRKLAEEMNVSPQQVNKIVSGKENLTLETITNLEAILNISILVNHSEKEIIKEKRMTTIIEDVICYHTAVNQVDICSLLIQTSSLDYSVIQQQYVSTKYTA